MRSAPLALMLGVVTAAIGCGDRHTSAPPDRVTPVAASVDAHPSSQSASRPAAIATTPSTSAARRPWRTPVLNPADYAKAVDECMNYSPSPDLIVFTQGGYEGQRLRHAAPEGAYYITDGGGTTAFAPREWETLNPTSPLSGIHRAGWYGSLMFMHARRTPAGRELLVVATWPHYSGEYGLRVTVTELDRGNPAKRRECTTFAVPRAALLTVADPQPGLPFAGELLRFFAGQPDPIDESAWSIRYTVAADKDVYAGKVEKVSTGWIRMKLTGEPELAEFDWPLRNKGKVPMEISVTRPDDTAWKN